jgi:hypothetical protein
MISQACRLGLSQPNSCRSHTDTPRPMDVANKWITWNMFLGEMISEDASSCSHPLGHRDVRITIGVRPDIIPTFCCE